MLLRKTQSQSSRCEVQTSGRMEIESINVYALSGQMSESSLSVLPFVRFETEGTTVWYFPTSRFALSDTRASTGILHLRLRGTTMNFEKGDQSLREIVCAIGSDVVDDNNTKDFFKLTKQHHSLERVERCRPITSTVSVSIRDGRSLARLVFGPGHLGFHKLGLTKEEVTSIRGRIKPGKVDGTISNDSHRARFSVCQE
jgi:hypothetical protein